MVSVADLNDLCPLPRPGLLLVYEPALPWAGFQLLSEKAAVMATSARTMPAGTFAVGKSRFFPISGIPQR